MAALGSIGHILVAVLAVFFLLSYNIYCTLKDYLV